MIMGADLTCVEWSSFVVAWTAYLGIPLRLVTGIMRRSWKEIYMIHDGSIFSASCIMLEQLLHIPMCHGCIAYVVGAAQERGEYRSRNGAMLHPHIDDK
jgi:hypothetical protein